MSNQRTAQVVIIGGGVAGLSIACHLARLGIDDVLLVERNRLASGTSWHAAGIIGPLRASMNLTRLAAFACELLPRMKEETGQDTGFLSSGETIRCKSVVNCAGVWAREVGRMAGVPVPVQPVEHMYLVTDSRPRQRHLRQGPHGKGGSGWIRTLPQGVGCHRT
ncbi:MAG: FAD-dependent oxidoreductase [bacterium]|nr:FAD-dependent oxidoreductase [bacterium]